MKEQLRKDYQVLKENLQTNLILLLEQGIDLDDLFKDDTEEIVFNFSYGLPMDKSPISHTLHLDLQASLKLAQQRKNMEIQTTHIGELPDNGFLPPLRTIQTPTSLKNLKQTDSHVSLHA